MEKKRINQVIGLVTLLVLANLILIIYFFPFSTQKGKLQVVFLDIGQGDAILIQTPNGKNILIDGGPDRTIIYKLSSYIPQNRRRIDLMILTHPDVDHLTGLIEVLKYWDVKNVIYNGAEDDDPIYQQWQNLIRAKNIPIFAIRKEQIVRIEKDLYFDFFWPDKDMRGQYFDNDNFYSLVMKLNFKNNSILFMGDAEKDVEEELIGRNINLRADILKVAHHGSKNATSLKFLEKVRPVYAVVSVGKDNPFGHPSFRVISNLKRMGINILRTDKIGDIIFRSNGYSYELVK